MRKINKTYVYKSLLGVTVYLGLLALFLILTLSAQLCIGSIKGLSFNESVNRYIFDYSMIDKTFLGAMVSFFALNRIFYKSAVKITLKEKLPAYGFFALTILLLVLTFSGVISFKAG
ncbi:MAG: hypothetical protein OEY00_11210 [Gammaproteobacteria bacterium]|nr:hypothetical protein [Gammaproteobacteria bacterium]